MFAYIFTANNLTSASRERNRNAECRKELAKQATEYLTFCSDTFSLFAIIINRKSTQKKPVAKISIIALSAHYFDIDGTETEESEGVNRA